MKTRFLWAVALAGLALPLRAAPLIESTFTEVIKDVNVVASATKSATPAKANELFKAPDLVRTGAGSRAELTAPDQTITRVGANTVFSFEPAGRNLRLEQGSVLFHSPKGQGGGTIKSGGVAAAVLGTTLIVSATADGGFKVILLEGKGQVTLPNGKSVTLKAGQLVFVLPGGNTFSPVLDINLDKLVSGSQLVNGFSHELSSLSLIQKAIAGQKSDLASGKTVDTGVSADNFVHPPAHGNGLNTMDDGLYQVAAHPPLTKSQLNQLVNLQDPAKPVFGNPGGRGFTPVDPASFETVNPSVNSFITMHAKSVFVSGVCLALALGVARAKSPTPASRWTAPGGSASFKPPSPPAPTPCRNFMKARPATSARSPFCRSSATAPSSRPLPTSSFFTRTMCSSPTTTSRGPACSSAPCRPRSRRRRMNLPAACFRRASATSSNGSTTASPIRRRCWSIPHSNTSTLTSLISTSRPFSATSRGAGKTGLSPSAAIIAGCWIPDDYSEFYHEFVPRWAVRRDFQLCDSVIVSVGYEGDYRFTESTPPAAVNPTSPNYPDTFNDRTDQSLVLVGNWQLCRHAILQPFYRLQYSHYTQIDRDDWLNSFGLTLYCPITKQISLRTFVSYDIAEHRRILCAEFPEARRRRRAEPHRPLLKNSSSPRDELRIVVGVARRAGIHDATARAVAGRASLLRRQ